MISKSKNKTLLMCVFVLLTCISSLVIALAMKPTVEISEATNAKIKAGMTRAEVEQIIGGRTGDYSSKPVRVIDVAANLGWHDKDTWWIGEHHAIAVRFDDNGNVEESRCCEVYPK